MNYLQKRPPPTHEADVESEETVTENISTIKTCTFSSKYLFYFKVFTQFFTHYENVISVYCKI
jgi:hypothetical protein